MSFTSPSIALVVDREVATLDPLGLNAFFGDTFAHFANTPNSFWIERFIRNELSNSVTAVSFETIATAEAKAVIRDVATILCAARKFGLQPAEFPAVEKSLFIASKIAGELPTDTVYSYTTRNPSGRSQRRFTNSPEETCFIQALTEGVFAVDECLQHLVSVRNDFSLTTETLEKLKRANAALSVLVQGMREVREKISPQYFTGTLRPFFEPKIVCGESYNASNGAQMPLMLVDEILWGSSYTDHTWFSYQTDLFKYFPQPYKNLFESITREPSIVDLLVAVETRKLSLDSLRVAKAIAAEVSQLLMTLVRFRAPHYKTAHENMKLRDEGSKGSGGYDTEILKFMIAKTTDARDRLIAAGLST